MDICFHIELETIQENLSLAICLLVQKRCFFTAYEEAPPQCINANAYSGVPNKCGVLITVCR